MSACGEPIVNAFSIDVEDWFQVAAFENSIRRDDWPSLPCRVERNVHALLDLLDAHRTQATFFVLGWIAERHPGLVREIAARGHEIASHGYGHARVAAMTPDAFRADGLRARSVLEDTAAVPIRGYRAPSFSIDPGTMPWAIDTLEAMGFAYSSSVYPVRHDLYGSPDAPRFVHRIRPGLLEIPPTTIRVAGRNLPAAGGGFFRLLPYVLSRWTLRRVNRVDQRAAMFYCHPWEVDPGQPRVAGAPVRSRLRHYLNLSRTLPRLDRLLGDFRWDRIDRVFAAELATPTAAVPSARRPAVPA